MREQVREYQKQIMLLTAKLQRTDYKAIKYAERLLSEEEYEPIKAERQAWRDEINELESKIQQLKG